MSKLLPLSIIKNIPNLYETENQEEKIIKISFRSQGDFDVNEFARNHFNGGGHINAAGGKSEESLSATVAKFVELVHQLNI